MEGNGDEQPLSEAPYIEQHSRGQKDEHDARLDERHAAQRRSSHRSRSGCRGPPLRERTQATLSIDWPGRETMVHPLCFKTPPISTSTPSSPYADGT